MKSESDKRKLWIFMGCLLVIAWTINSFFTRPPIPDPVPSQTISRPQLNPPAAASPPAVDYEANVRRVREEAARVAAEEAEGRQRQAAQEAVEQHARFLARYINPGFSKASGKQTVAVIVVTESGKLDHTVNSALSRHFQGSGAEVVSSFFTPEFVSDGLFNNIFNGSTDPIRKLELSNSLDAILLARQTVQYSTDPSLENVMSAHLQVEISLVPVSGNMQSQAWTFSANGAGFRQSDARSMAEERLIKQISTDTKMTFN
jgi:hypothetical protein